EPTMNQLANVHSLQHARPFADRLDGESLNRIFRQARSHNGWLNRPVPHGLIEEAVDLAKLGPTAVNASPLRLVFVESEAAKARLKPALSPGNLDKTMAA